MSSSRANALAAIGAVSRFMAAQHESDVIVIGGGVAGLAAASVLGRQRSKVTLLEARDRLGGRICTIHPKGWNAPVEVGAEFIHGGNAAFWRFIRQHRLGTKHVPPHHWLSHAPGFEKIDDLADRIERVTGRIKPRRMRGWSFADFMRGRARSFEPDDRSLALSFVEGFQAAPTGRMSAAAIADETLDDEEQFHVPRGYDRLVDALATECRRQRVMIHLKTAVTRIEWRRGDVCVRAGGRQFRAAAVIVTLPLGVWQARAPRRGAIRFVPALKSKQIVVRRMGVGHVIRIVVRFKARDWQRLLPDDLRRRARGGFGFIHSRVDGVPVWWSLTGAPVLTGWAGGPAAVALARCTKRGILKQALRSLSRVFGRNERDLARAVAGWETHNWSRDPFSRCAYSFIAAGAEKAAENLRLPMQGTLFFAGEATADGEEVGTVHGAFSSGLRAAAEAAKARRARESRK